MVAIEQCEWEKCGCFKRIESWGRWKPGGSGGRSAFPASGDEPEGAPLIALRVAGFFGNLGGNAEVFRPKRDGGLFLSQLDNKWREFI